VRLRANTRKEGRGGGGAYKPRKGGVVGQWGQKISPRFPTLCSPTPPSSRTPPPTPHPTMHRPPPHPTPMHSLVGGHRVHHAHHLPLQITGHPVLTISQHPAVVIILVRWMDWGGGGAGVGGGLTGGKPQTKHPTAQHSTAQHSTAQHTVQRTAPGLGLVQRLSSQLEQL